MTTVYESLFRLGDARPPAAWEGADGVVVLTEDGHLLGAKAELGDRVWETVNTRLTDVASRVHPGSRPAYLEDVWPVTSPVERFLLASLVTDGRAHRCEAPLDHAAAGPVLGIYSNEAWSEEQIEETLTAVLDRVVRDDLEDHRLMISDLLDLPRRP